MKGLYKQFATDTNIEKAGIDLQYGTPEEPIIITIARAGGANTAYNRVLERVTKPYRRQIQTNTMEHKMMQKLLMEVYAEAVVLKWDGVTDKEGNEIPFSKENCVNLFIDLPDLFADVKEQAESASIFRTEVLEDAVKN